MALAATCTLLADCALKVYIPILAILVIIIGSAGTVGQLSVISNSPQQFLALGRCDEDDCYLKQVGNTSLNCTCSPLEKLCKTFQIPVTVNGHEVGRWQHHTNRTASWQHRSNRTSFGTAMTAEAARCGISEQCVPNLDKVEKSNVHDPLIPYCVIWVFFKMIKIFSLLVTEDKHGKLVDGVYHMPPRFQQFIFNVNKMLMVGRLMMHCPWACGLCIMTCLQKGFKKLEPLTTWMKFTLVPSIVVAELANLTGHPNCDEFLVSFLPNLDIPLWAYYLCGAYTVAIFFVIPCGMYTKQDRITKQKGEDTAIDNLIEGKKCCRLYVVFALFLIFGADVFMVVICVMWLVASLEQSGFSVFLGLQYTFAVDVKASVSIDIFQFFLGVLVVLETVEFIGKTCKTIAKGCYKHCCCNKPEDTAEPEEPAAARPPSTVSTVVNGKETE